MHLDKYPRSYAERFGRRAHRLFAALTALAFGTGLAILLSVIPALLQPTIDPSLFVENLLTFEPFAAVCSLMSFVAFPRRPTCNTSAERWVFKGLFAVLLTFLAVALIDTANLLQHCIVPFCEQSDSHDALQRFGSEIFLIFVASIFLILAPWFLGGYGGFVIWRCTRAQPHDD